MWHSKFPMLLLSVVVFSTTAVVSTVIRENRMTASYAYPKKKKVFDPSYVVSVNSVVGDLADQTNADVAVYYSIRCFNLSQAYEKCALIQECAKIKQSIRRVYGHGSDYVPPCILSQILFSLAGSGQGSVLVKPYSELSIDSCNVPDATVAASLILRDGDNVEGILIVGWLKGNKPTAVEDHIRLATTKISEIIHTKQG